MALDPALQWLLGSWIWTILFPVFAKKEPPWPVIGWLLVPTAVFAPRMLENPSPYSSVEYVVQVGAACMGAWFVLDFCIVQIVRVEQDASWHGWWDDDPSDDPLKALATPSRIVASLIFSTRYLVILVFILEFYPDWVFGFFMKLVNFFSVWGWF